MSTRSIETGSLGFPRIGQHRELKFALERFWSGEWSAEQLAAAAREMRRGRWQMQAAAGIHNIPDNDFSLYDHVLDTAVMVGAIELLEAFAGHGYPNDIGPGIYDVHSPSVSGIEEIKALLRKALSVLRLEQLWVNPDCGLKTRRWEEVQPALRNIVAAARRVHEATRPAPTTKKMG